MYKLKRWMNRVLKKVRIAVSSAISALVEAARTISYVETVSNKADTIHRHVKNSDEKSLKKAFEFNTRKAIQRMGIKNATFAVDTTKELYYGKNGKLNTRRKKYEKGTDQVFEYLVLSIVSPKPLPLMAIPYRQGEDLSSLCKEILEFARSLKINIQCILFDRGFYIGELIDYLSSRKLNYLIFVPQNSVMKRFISETNLLKSFEHEIKWNKNFSWWKTKTQIVVVKSQYFNKKKKKFEDCYWCFATNLKQSFSLIKKYKQRWQIETDFRVHDEARIKSKSNNHLIRYFYFLSSLLLMANWQVNRGLHPKVCFKKYLKLVEENFSDYET